MSENRKSAAKTDKYDSETIKDHRALKNQSSVKPTDYPASQLKDQLLVRPNKKAD